MKCPVCRNHELKMKNEDIFLCNKLNMMFEKTYLLAFWDGHTQGMIDYSQSLNVINPYIEKKYAKRLERKNQKIQ